ncbi:MAG: multidrug transporter MatE, partial [Lachnospiraceae bacterium]
MKLYKEFFRYVIPSMLAFALSGLYGIVDGFFLGNEMGDQALAAINVA